MKDGIVAIKAQSRALAAIRDALLPKLISGEVRLRDSDQVREFEPA